MTFNFLYTEQHRRTPDRAPVLEQTWRAVLEQVVRHLEPPGRVAVGGKSMGGRIASPGAAHVPEDPAWQKVDGLVLLGYPLHPPGQPDRSASRAICRVFAMPILLVQGTRDTFGTRDGSRARLRGADAPVDFEFIDGGDHGFAVPKSSGRTEADVHDAVADRISAWLQFVTLVGRGRGAVVSRRRGWHAPWAKSD